MPSVLIQNLHVSLGGNDILRGIDLNVAPASSLVILGGSGSGKSVLLKTIIGLLPIKSGKILIDDKENKYGKITPKCGMLFQGGALFDSLTAGANIAFGLPQGTKNKRQKIMELLAMVDLDQSVADLYPESLSGGMRKRVSMARTIAQQPDIILFDEPTTGLDPITAELINKLILRLIHSMSITAITVTHDMQSAITIANSIAMIENGKIAIQDTIDNFLKNDHETVKKFLIASGFYGKHLAQPIIV